MTDLYETIRTITETKKRAKLFPTFALDPEVHALYLGGSFEQEIKTLASVGLIHTGRTINHTYYEIVEI